MSMSDVDLDRAAIVQWAVGMLREIRDDSNALGGAPNSEYERGVHDTVARMDSIIEAKIVEIAQ